MATTTSVSSALTDVPDILKPYITGAGGVLPTAQGIVGQTYDQRYGNALNQAGLAGAGRVASLAPMQEQIGNQLSTMQAPSQFAQGVGAVNQGLSALNQSVNAYGNVGNVNNQNLNQYQMSAAPNVAATSLNNYQIAAPQDVNAQNLTAYQMQGPDQYTGNQVSQYASPYMQQVVEIQKQEALRDAQRQLVGANLGSARQGTYGGARNALMQSEANRNLQTQMANIQATGSQKAFENAQNQFNTYQQANQATRNANLQAQLGVQQLGSGQNLQAQLANQAANQARDLANMQSFLGVQQLGSAQDLQARLANQGVEQGANQANLQALLNVQQLGSAQDLQARLANQGVEQGANQANLQALLGVQQLGSAQSMEAQRANQAAALARAQGYGQAGQAFTQSGSTLGALGTADQAALMDILKAKGAYGDLQRNVQQNQLDAQYNDLMTKLNQPLTNVEIMNNLARGVPLTQTGTTTSTTTPPPSFASQLAGTGLTGLSLYNMFGKP